MEELQGVIRGIYRSHGGTFVISGQLESGWGGGWRGGEETEEVKSRFNINAAKSPRM